MKNIRLIILLKLFIILIVAFGISYARNDIRADYILVEKEKRTLALFSHNKEIRRYKISLGGDTKGHKEKEGDEKTPEGIYTIDYRVSNSKFHRALHISYPNEQDIEHAKENNVSPGGDIMIHGIKNGFGWIGRLHRFIDWTDGCIAVSNKEIEEIWSLVPDGTAIEIKP